MRTGPKEALLTWSRAGLAHSLQQSKEQACQRQRTDVKLVVTVMEDPPPPVVTVLWSSIPVPRSIFPPAPRPRSTSPAEPLMVMWRESSLLGDGVVSS